MTPYPIDDAAARRRLDPSPSPYFRPVTPAVHLGYRKGLTGSRWVLRRRVGGRYQTRTFREFVPDDRLPADGDTVRSFDQMLMRVLNMDLNHPDAGEGARRACSFCGKPDTAVAALCWPGRPVHLRYVQRHLPRDPDGVSQQSRPGLD